MKLSIKSPRAILWKTGHDPCSIEQALASKKITADWLVCPLGEALKSMTVGEFLGNPTAFNPPEKKQPIQQTPEIKVSQNCSLFRIGLVTLLISAATRLFVHKIAMDKVRNLQSFESIYADSGFLSLCNELITIGLWAGAFLMVVHVVRNKTDLA